MKRAVKAKKKLGPYDGLYGRQEKAARKKPRRYFAKDVRDYVSPVAAAKAIAEGRAIDYEQQQGHVLMDNPMPPDLDDIGLRQWCVEQAFKWPVLSLGGGTQQYQPPPNHVTDADIIGRSIKLYRWVTGKDA